MKEFFLKDWVCLVMNGREAAIIVEPGPMASY